MEDDRLLKKVRQTAEKRQYYATFFATLAFVSYGIGIGWTSPNFPILRSEDSPLPSGPITVDEMSWIGSIMHVGGLFGTIVFGWLIDVIGRKRTCILCAFPQIISWLLVVFATSPTVLMISRFFTGVGGGGAIVAVPMFTSEIAEDRLRGFLGSTLVLSANAGVLYAFTLGNVASFEAQAWIYLLIPIIFLIGFSFVPETPLFLLKQNRFTDAEKSLRYYRGLKENFDTEDFKSELIELKNIVERKESSDQRKISLKNFTTPVARRALIIGVGLVALNQFSGCFAMIHYTANIFAESGSDLSPNLSAIVVGAIQLLGSYFTTLLVERAGRKLLIVVSALGISIGLLVLGTYSYLKSAHYDVTSFRWVPLTSFSFAIFIANMGVLSIPYVVIAEIMPHNIKSVATSFCMTMQRIFAIIVIKYLPFLIEKLDMHGAMFVFSMCSLAGGVFAIFMQPETKGRTLEEISRLLEKR